jgi:hypothetical protein
MKILNYFDDAFNIVLGNSRSLRGVRISFGTGIWRRQPPAKMFTFGSHNSLARSIVVMHLCVALLK